MNYTATRVASAAVACWSREAKQFIKIEVPGQINGIDKRGTV